MLKLIIFFAISTLFYNVLPATSDYFLDYRIFVVIAIALFMIAI